MPSPFILRLLSLILLWTSLSGCIIGRDYKGSPLREAPAQTILPGKTTQTEILALFGPPQEILPQKTGYLFVYRYTQTNSWKIVLQEPVFTQRVFFTYEKNNEKSDALVVLFRPDGTVQNYGLNEDIQNLTFL